jgi:glycosyltransferase involved in cell wall biosynthesis
MNIIHLSPSCADVGNGVVNVAIDLACSQSAGGHHVSFVSQGGDLVPLLEKYDVSHHAIDFGSRNLRTMATALVSLHNVLKRIKPDIVHAHMVPGAVFANVLRLTAHYKIVTTVHNAPKPQAVLMGMADRVIVVSSSNFDLMRARGISARRIRIVKNGPLGSPRRNAAQFAEVSLHRPAVVTVARLFIQKGIADLIRAFELVSRECTEAQLYIVGEGPERRNFEQIAARTTCSDKVCFVGFVKDPRPYLSQADVFVLASHADPFPLVIPEAREAGCAIVATDVDGIPEGLNGGKAGIMVPPSNPVALAKAILGLLQNPDQLALWRQRAAHDLDWLNINRVSSETVAVYEELLS